MVHCDKELYQKVITENFKNLLNVALIGNSLMKYNQNLEMLQKPKIEVFEVFIKNIMKINKTFIMNKRQFPKISGNIN